MILVEMLFPISGACPDETHFRHLEKWVRLSRQNQRLRIGSCFMFNPQEIFQKHGVFEILHETKSRVSGKHEHDDCAFNKEYWTPYHMTRL